MPQRGRIGGCAPPRRRSRVGKSGVERDTVRARIKRLGIGRLRPYATTGPVFLGRCWSGRGSPAFRRAAGEGFARTLLQRSGGCVTFENDAGRRRGRRGVLAAGAATKTAEMNAIDKHDDRGLPGDGPPFRPRLARAMRSRGFEVSTADSAAAGGDGVRRHASAFAVPGLKDGNRLDAVAAVEAGAVGCLARPTDAGAAAPLVTGSTLQLLPEHPLFAERVRRKRIPRGCERRGETSRRGRTRVVEPCDASWPGARRAKPAMHRGVPRSRRARRETWPC